MLNEKKYELTPETIEVSGHTLYRIKALRDFGLVKKGQLGGFIESENNLAHAGNAWVYDNAKVCGNAEVYGNAWVYDNAWVGNDAKVFGYAEVCGYAEVYGCAWVYDNAWVGNDAKVFGYAEVCGYAEVYGCAKVCGYAKVCGNAKVFGNAWVYDNAKVCGNAKVSSIKDYLVFKNWWSSGRYFTWTRSNDKWKVGCFYGTGEELIAKAYRDSEPSGREYERIVRYVEEIKNVINQ